MNSLLMLVYYALTIYQVILLARVLMTWLPNLDYHNPIVRFLMAATEPVLAPIRRLLPNTGGIDFSPLIVFLAIYLLMQLLF